MHFHSAQNMPTFSKEFLDTDIKLNRCKSYFLYWRQGGSHYTKFRLEKRLLLPLERRLATRKTEFCLFLNSAFLKQRK